MFFSCFEVMVICLGDMGYRSEYLGVLVMAWRGIIWEKNEQEEEQEGFADILFCFLRHWSLRGGNFPCVRSVWGFIMGFIMQFGLAQVVSTN